MSWLFFRPSAAIDFLCAQRQLVLRHNGVSKLCNRTVAWPQPKSHELPGAFIDELVVLSGATTNDRITVAGRKTLDVLVGLCRRGFLHCSCRALGATPCAGDDCSDALWILETQDAAELRTVLANCGRDLRSEGKLIVGFNMDGRADKPARLAEVLVKCGFIPMKEAHSAGHGFLVCTRKQAGLHALAA